MHEWVHAYVHGGRDSGASRRVCVDGDSIRSVVTRLWRDVRGTRTDEIGQQRDMNDCANEQLTCKVAAYAVRRRVHGGSSAPREGVGSVRQRSYIG